jgi:hypothetical protein
VHPVADSATRLTEKALELWATIKHECPLDDFRCSQQVVSQMDAGHPGARRHDPAPLPPVAGLPGGLVGIAGSIVTDPVARRSPKSERNRAA